MNGTSTRGRRSKSVGILLGIYNAPRQGLGPQLLSGGHSAELWRWVLEKRLPLPPRVDDPWLAGVADNGLISAATFGLFGMSDSLSS